MMSYGEKKVDLCQGLKDWAEEERTAGREEGIKFVALRLNEKGRKIQDIADVAGVSVETVEKWINASEG